MYRSHRPSPFTIFSNYSRNEMSECISVGANKTDSDNKVFQNGIFLAKKQKQPPLKKNIEKEENHPTVSKLGFWILWV